MQELVKLKEENEQKLINSEVRKLNNRDFIKNNKR